MDIDADGLTKECDRVTIDRVTEEKERTCATTMDEPATTGRRTVDSETLGAETVAIGPTKGIRSRKSERNSVTGKALGAAIRC